MSHLNKYKDDKTVKQEKIDTDSILNQLNLRNRWIDPDFKGKIKEIEMAVYYNYKLDKQLANKSEHEVATLICKIQKCKLVKVGYDNKYDLKFEKEGAFTTVEVKEDFTCQRTGNVGLEFSCRGKDSGIAVSRADFYSYKIHEPNGSIGYYLIRTSVLKKLILNKNYHRIVNGGDPESNSLNYLFKLETIKKHAIKIGELT